MTQTKLSAQILSTQGIDLGMDTSADKVEQQAEQFNQALDLDPLLKYRAQHQHRLNYMPWLYWRLKAKHRAWADSWQKEYQDYLQAMETVEIGQNCFISPLAHIFAEPGRKVVIADNTFIAADCVIHGPVTIGAEVAINHHCVLEGGRVGIEIADQARLAAYCHLYAFEHGIGLHEPMYQQPVTSKGIRIGRDVWLGAHVGVKDGVHIADHAVVGMHSMVTKSVAEKQIVVGNPARFLCMRGE